MSHTSARLRRAAVLLVMLSCAANWPPSFANADTRSSAQSDRDLFLAAREEIAVLTARVASLTKLDAQNKGLIEALDAQIAALEKTVASWKAAAATGEKIEGVDAKQIASLEASLKDAKNQIEKWKGRATFWKRIAAIGVLGAAAIGVVIGVVISR